jgi:hypothetical protein
MARKIRQSVTFTGNTADFLEESAARRGVPVSEIVRQAVALEAWFQGVEASGAKVLVQRENETTPREVEFVSR